MPTATKPKAKPAKDKAKLPEDYERFYTDWENQPNFLFRTVDRRRFGGEKAQGYKNLCLVKQGQGARALPGEEHKLPADKQRIAADFGPRGFYGTDDPEMAQWLREHRWFGVRFTELTGQDRAPAASELMSKLMPLAIARDENTLTAIYNRESETWKRKQVLDACAEALRALEE